jgi:MFS family permease
MKFLLLSLITYLDRSKTTEQRLREVVDAAVLGEELGFDGFNGAAQAQLFQVTVDDQWERGSHPIRRIAADGRRGSAHPAAGHRRRRAAHHHHHPRSPRSGTVVRAARQGVAGLETSRTGAAFIGDCLWQTSGMDSRPPSISRPMRNLLAGFYTSLLGTQMVPVALAFAVLASGHGVSGLGLVLGASRLPTVGFILVGGVLADRLSRRSLLLISDGVRAVSQAALAIWWFTGHVPLGALMVFAAVDGLGNAFFRPALSGLIPSLNAPANLQRANALVAFGRSLSSLAGPAASGLLVAAFNPGTVFAIDAVSYVISVLFLLAVPRDTVARRTEPTRVLADLREGWAEFRSRRWLWAGVLQGSLIHLCVLSAYLVLGPQIAADSLGGPRGWGFTLAGFGAGAAVGGLLMVRVTPRRPLMLAMAASIGWAAVLLPLAFAASLPLVIAGAFLAGTGAGVFSTLWETTVQSQVPRDVLSRVTAYDWFGSLITLPLGYVLIGFAAPTTGAEPLLVIGAVIAVTSGAALMSLPEVRSLTNAHAAGGHTRQRATP